MDEKKGCAEQLNGSKKSMTYSSFHGCAVDLIFSLKDLANDKVVPNNPGKRRKRQKVKRAVVVYPQTRFPGTRDGSTRNNGRNKRVRKSNRNKKG